VGETWGFKRKKEIWKLENGVNSRQRIVPSCEAVPCTGIQVMGIAEKTGVQYFGGEKALVSVKERGGVHHGLCS